jgi:hypothetical protein
MKARLAVIWSKALPDNPDLFEGCPYLTGFPHPIDEIRHSGVLRLPEVSEQLIRTIRQPPLATYFRSGHIELEAWAIDFERRTAVPILNWTTPV